jgi:peptidyl-tRNA hydrolase
VPYLKKNRKGLALVICGFTAVLTSSALAASAEQFRPVISKPKAAIAKLDPRSAGEFPKILDAVASALLWKPYELGPLGEGPGSDHPKPLYRIDAFDCTTFIETVMANAYCFRAGSGSQSCLKKYMQKIRYGGEKISFRERNHIPELDWLPHNVQRGYLQDLNGTIFPGEWKNAEATINRELWLESVGSSKKNTGELPKSSKGGVAFLPVSFFMKQAELSAEAKKATDEKLALAKNEVTAKAETDEDQDELDKEKFRADLAYLRATYVPEEKKLRQIPSGTILNLVHSPLRDKTKARLSPVITHQGLIVQRADGAHILHAAPASKHVSDQPLGDYLLRYVRSANYRGISLFQILPKK